MAEKRKCLILLTSGFPFVDCEPYLESEISKHLENFDKIIILAQERSRNAARTRRVPEGIDVYNTAKHSKLIGRASDFARGIIKLPFDPVRKYDRSETAGSVKKNVFLEYFIQRGTRQYRECMAILEKYDLSLFDEVVLYSYNFFGLAYAGSLIKNDLTKRGIKTFLFSRAHAYDTYDCDNSLHYLPLRRLLLEAVDELLVCSDSGRRYIAGKYPEFSDKISLSYLGSGDYGTGFCDGVFRLVSCSRVDPEKNLYELIDALALLKNRGNIPEVRWTHIGAGKEYEKVKAYASKKLGFMNVTFTGIVSNTQVYDYYKNNPVSLFINKSLSEGLPVSIMEATSFGIPVLATNAGGTGELVIDGVTGKLVDKSISPEDYANEIVRLAGMSEADYNGLRASTRKYWEDNFNADANYRKFSQHIANWDESIAEKESQYAAHQ